MNESSDRGVITVGWIGAGRMGAAMASRLARAGEDVTVWNRTRAKAEAADRGRLCGRRHDRRAARPRRRVHHGLDARRPRAGARRRGRPAGRPRPRARACVVDCSTVSTESSAAMRAACAGAWRRLPRRPGQRQRQGGPGRVASAWSSPVPRRPTSGSRTCSTTSARASTYVGEGDVARLVKICHNLMLGVVTQCLAEITVLAEKGGMSRAAFLEFLNNSRDGLGVHPLQDAGVRAPRLHADVHADPAAQGLRPRVRGGPRARRADAGRRGHGAAGAGQRQQRPGRGGLRDPARPAGRGAPGITLKPEDVAGRRRPPAADQVD